MKRYKVLRIGFALTDVEADEEYCETVYESDDRLLAIIQAEGVFEPEVGAHEGADYLNSREQNYAEKRMVSLVLDMKEGVVEYWEMKDKAGYGNYGS